MKILETTNRGIGTWFIEGFEDTDNKNVRIRHGLVAGWVSIFVTLCLFVLKMVLGLMAGSISVVAEEVLEAEFETIATDLASHVKAMIPNVAYSQFYVTPKFSY
jgi:hypothetical protein